MKWNIITICIILFSISESLGGRKEYKSTLNKELDRVADKSSYTEDKFFKNLNISCITEKLKLSENGDKEIFKAETEILMMKAITSCSEFDEIEFWKDGLNRKPGHSIFEAEPEDIPCAKLKLHQMDPTFELIKDFNPESINEDEKMYCDEKTRADDFNTKKMISEALELPRLWKGIDHLSNFMCNSFDMTKFTKIFYTMQILWHGNKVNESIIDNIARSFAEIIDKAFECRMSKLNNM